MTEPQATHETQQTAASRNGDTDHMAGRYLTFGLGDETYGANILRVREIIGLQNITRVPDTAAYLKGVINLRGQVIAVMDLRLRFGMPEAAHTDETCIVIIESGGTMTGVIADRVREVVDLTGANIEPPPEYGSELDNRFIMGMGKTGDRIVIMLDTDAVVAVNRT